MAQENETRLNIIVAIGHDAAKRHVIGSKGQLLWSIPADLKRFKELTTGHPVIMGRKTWESLPENVRPLPGRTNIVVTRDASYVAPGALLAQSFPEALSRAKASEGSEEIFAIGGTQIYECALPFAQRLYLTVVDDEKEGDVFFPQYESEFTHLVSDEVREHSGLSYRWQTLERA